MTSPTLHRIRLRFAKLADLRLVSHHDLMRCLERAIRRAELPVATTQGFNPRPRIVFALALALGIEALHEAVDIDLTQPLDPDEVLRRLNQVAPDGLRFLEATALTDTKAPRPVAAEYRMQLPADRIDPARSAADQLIDSTTRPYLRRRADQIREIDLRPYVLHTSVDDRGILSLRLKVDPAGSARPEEVLETLGLRDLLAQGAFLSRSDVELDP